MKYELIVFDWDGTLMDSAARIVTCVQRAAAAIQRPVPTPDAARDVIGLGLNEAIETLFPGVDDAGQTALVQAYRHHWLSDELAPSMMFPGAEDLLQQLAEAGYLLAVATGKSRRGLDKVLAETGLTDRFHVTRCADETFSKPHPQMLHEILTDLDTEPDRAILIGDTVYDMQMAANARIDAAGVAHGVHEVGRLSRQGALTIFAGLAEISDWLINR